MYVFLKADDENVRNKLLVIAAIDHVSALANCFLSL